MRRLRQYLVLQSNAPSCSNERGLNRGGSIALGSRLECVSFDNGSTEKSALVRIL